MLVKNSIFCPKQFSINIAKRLAFIASCKNYLNINIKQKGQFVQEKVFSQTYKTITPQSKSIIAINYAVFSNNRNFFLLSHCLVSLNVPRANAKLELFLFKINPIEMCFFQKNSSLKIL